MQVFCSAFVTFFRDDASIDREYLRAFREFQSALVSNTRVQCFRSDKKSLSDLRRLIINTDDNCNLNFFSRDFAPIDGL